MSWFLASPKTSDFDSPHSPNSFLEACNISKASALLQELPLLSLLSSPDDSLVFLENARQRLRMTIVTTATEMSIFGI